MRRAFVGVDGAFGIGNFRICEREEFIMGFYLLGEGEILSRDWELKGCLDFLGIDDTVGIIQLLEDN